MKKLFPIIIISLFTLFVSCNTPNNKKLTDNNTIDIEQEQEAVKVILDKYRLVNETENIDLAKEIWANSDEIFVFGTSNDEKLIGWNAIKLALKSQFEQLDNILISVQNQYVKVNSTANTAWFSEIMNYNYVQDGEAKSFEGVRFSGVMEKEGTEWRIVQSHISIAGGGAK